MKKWIGVAISLFMIIPFFGTIVGASVTINLGDYVQLGSYYGEPILWRCVDIDPTNGPLMLSDKILTFKSFDANGTHKYVDGIAQADTNSYRTSYGSNIWQTASIRSWLNSNNTSNNIYWYDSIAPTSDKLWGFYNAYANEKGFLAEGNFTVSEQNAIKKVTQKSLINNVDTSKLNISGTANHTYHSTISTAVQNYSDAYYQNTTDKMFLLDVNQLDKVYQNSATLGANYYIGKPTQKALDNSEYKNTDLSPSNYWYSWLRTPYADPSNPSYVRLVSSDGYVDIHNAYYNYVGVRPAFYINTSYINLISGTGTINTPYTTATSQGNIDFKGSSLGDPSYVIFPKDGGQHNLTATYQNNTNETQSTMFVVAVKKDSKLISVSTMENTFAPSSEFTFNNSINIPSTLDSTNVEVDFYIWNGLNIMKSKHDTVKNSINNIR